MIFIFFLILIDHVGRKLGFALGTADNLTFLECMHNYIYKVPSKSNADQHSKDEYRYGALGGRQGIKTDEVIVLRIILFGSRQELTIII